MTRPAFQFYPADWRNNAKLRRCSPAARGVWMDILCLLHDGDEYGVLRWPLKDVANAAGASMALVRELVSKGVLKGADSEAPAYVYRPKHAGKLGEPVMLATADGGPIWYCSRFVRDEWIRQRRGESTRFDTANQPDSRSPKVGLGERQGDGPSSSSPSSDSVPEGTDAAAAPAPDSATPTPKPEKSPEDMAKAELWRAAVSVLEQGGCPPSQCRTFMGKLVGDYSLEVVKAAVSAAVTAQPADAREYLKAVCQKLKGERKDPVTVASDAAAKTAALLAARVQTPEQRAASEAARRAQAGKLAALGSRRHAEATEAAP